VGYQGRVLTYDGSDWSKPEVVAGWALTSVSCSSPSYCVAVDFYGRALAYDGDAWSGPIFVSEEEPTSVSCPRNSASCTVVTENGYAITFNGVAASEPLKIAKRRLVSVSCALASFCAAVDWAGDALIYASPSAGSSGEGRVVPAATVRQAGRRPGGASARGLKVLGSSARIVLRCEGSRDSECRVALIMRRAAAPRRIVGRTMVRLVGGQRRSVSLGLSATGRRLLGREGRLKVRLHISQVTDGKIRVISRRPIVFRLKHPSRPAFNKYPNVSD
jgi:hypothetical protein